ncbi:SCO family protein [Dictyobacter alpinus]|uniref:SCO family protein n=1 Tax=Dictyobacter alpinus TaxID=2014873 RepID=A0A402B3I3_9CHLR|nr:SCO family protein [Dictyobacter alpinus]GCE25914.1 SCO family protein [Dictyobacter alpinus]
MSMRMSWRLASRLSVITLAVLVVIIVTVIQQKQSSHSQPVSNTTASTSGLQGTDLGGTPAPNFQLTDQYGKTVSLSQFRGKPVVVTFLYTHCPDVCPLTAENLHASLQKLGGDAKNVAILAVSTDPKRDTTAEALKFSTAHNMQDYWHFLTGTQKELSPIWSSYSIYAQQQQQKVNHSTALYVIDKQGKERVYMGDDFKPAQMAANLQQLLKEK